MELEEIQSEFQLKGCKVEKFELDNDFIALPEQEELKLSVAIKNAISDIDKIQDNILSANLKFDLEVTSKLEQNNKKLYIHILLDSFFIFEGDDKARFNEMLLLNGNATLYSIARSHIITLSALSCESGQIILPMINFVKLLQKTKQNNQKETN